MLETIIALIKKLCIVSNLNPALIYGLVKVESNFDTNAIRYEPNFSYISKPTHFAVLLHIPKAAEEAMQMTSWGLMQIMGARARDEGFTENLNQLLDPEENIELGIKIVSKLKKKYPKDTDLISVYNWGNFRKRIDGTYHNQRYVDRVLDAMYQYGKLDSQNCAHE